MSDGADLMTAEEVARRLRVSTTVVYKWARDNELPSFRVGKILRFRKADIDALVLSGGDEPEAKAG